MRRSVDWQMHWFLHRSQVSDARILLGSWDNKEMAKETTGEMAKEMAKNMTKTWPEWFRKTWFFNLLQPLKPKSERFYIVFTISKSLCTRKVDACFSVLSSSGHVSESLACFWVSEVSLPGLWRDIPESVGEGTDGDGTRFGEVMKLESGCSLNWLGNTQVQKHRKPNLKINTKKWQNEKCRVCVKPYRRVFWTFCSIWLWSNFGFASGFELWVLVWRFWVVWVILDCWTHTVCFIKVSSDPYWFGALFEFMCEFE